MIHLYSGSTLEMLGSLVLVVHHVLHQYKVFLWSLLQHYLPMVYWSKVHVNRSLNYCFIETLTPVAFKQCSRRQSPCTLKTCSTLATVLIEHTCLDQAQMYTVCSMICSVYEVMKICWAVDMRQRATFQKPNRMHKLVPIMAARDIRTYRIAGNFRG